MAAPFLSIIVPFYNSVSKCRRLMSVLAKLQPQDDVQLILVDDGSTDGTPALLRELASSCLAPAEIVERTNGGPGAARNSGLERASGKWVWFVDSDDCIDLRVLAVAKSAEWPETDMIIWDWHHPMPRDQLLPGVHQRRSSALPSDVMDPIVGNWFSLQFLRKTGLRFPENCYYEALPIEAFVLPLIVTDFVRVRYAPYWSNSDNRSVTRSEPRDPRRFDRLSTSARGMAYVGGAHLKPQVRAQFEAAFIRLFLWFSIRLSRWPGSSWAEAARVMRQYREEAAQLGIHIDPLALYPGRRASKAVVSLLWRLSARLPSQQAFFRRLRQCGWGREIVWDVPRLPSRWPTEPPHGEGGQESSLWAPERS
jgi:Glycosyl transferase family 2